MAEDVVDVARRVLARHTQDRPFCAACGDRVSSHPGGRCKYPSCPCPGLMVRDPDEVLLAKAYLEAVGAD